MKIRNYFDINRFLLLLKLELIRNSRAIAMIFVITFGLQFFVGLMLNLMIEGNVTTYQHHTDFVSSLLLGGFVLTSLAFNDLGNPLKRAAYFTLPVSALEKLLCMWLLTSVGWIIMFTVVYTCYSYLANPLAQVLFRSVKFESFNPVNEMVFTATKYYFVLHGIFLVGAAHFRGYAFAKTIFVVVVVALAMLMALYFLLLDVFKTEHDCTGYDCELLPQIAKHTAWQILTFFFWWMLAPLCWVLAYLGLKEQEV